MASVETLAAAIEALFPSLVSPHMGKVPPGQQMPWTLILASLPSPSERRLDGKIAHRRCVVRVRAVADVDQAVRQVADVLLPTLDGARINASGWTCSPLRQLNDDPSIYPDEDTKVSDGTRPLICAVDYEFYATED